MYIAHTAWHGSMGRGYSGPVSQYAVGVFSNFDQAMGAAREYALSFVDEEYEFKIEDVEKSENRSAGVRVEQDCLVGDDDEIFVRVEEIVVDADIDVVGSL